MMNKKHELFILEYINNGNNGTQAYLSVYPNVKESTARSNANKLLTNTDIISKLKQLQDDLFESQILSVKHRQKIVSEIVLNQSTSNSDKMKGVDLLNKMDGTYNEVNKPIEIKSDWFKWTIEK